ncbi:Cys/Met metabolism- pyridoxal phosphate-dependent enzyme [Apiospora phragmitis]|uniref:Cys/Met metabolism- pyridoxal phosphate-dependent enzyme n=1 Tax=Apiospora phragmitis TaxID=2905665 RepID=A0ABR1W667_9PEZI
MPASNRLQLEQGPTATKPGERHARGASRTTTTAPPSPRSGPATGSGSGRTATSRSTASARIEHGGGCVCDGFRDALIMNLLWKWIKVDAVILQVELEAAQELVAGLMKRWHLSFMTVEEVVKVLKQWDRAAMQSQMAEMEADFRSYQIRCNPDTTARINKPQHPFTRHKQNKSSLPANNSQLVSMESALPNELLLHILEVALPYDFESLVLTSKHMYAISRPLLARHKELRRKYRRFRFGEPSADLQVTTTMLELLLNIAVDPVIARYIVHLDLGDRECIDIRSDDDEFVSCLQRPGEKASLLELIKKSSHLSVFGLAPDVWFDCITADAYDFDFDGTAVDCAVAFLLSLLPNLESLALSEEWGEQNVTCRNPTMPGADDVVPNLLHLHVTRANDVGKVAADQDCPLRKPRKLRPTRDVDSQFGTDLEAIAPFLALNSIREVRFDKVVLESAVYVKDETNLVGNDDEDKHDGEDEIVTIRPKNKKLFLANLADAVGQHLEYLALAARILGDHAKLLLPEDDDLEDLHGFQALTHLELDTKLFIDSSADLSYHPDDNPPISIADIVGNVPSLVDVAPPTLREFVLHVLGTAEGRAVMESLFRDFSKRRDELPDLDSAVVIVYGQREWGGEFADWTEQYEIASFFFYPGEYHDFARRFWRISGSGISSRLAEDVLKETKTQTPKHKLHNAYDRKVSGWSCHRVIQRRIINLLQRGVTRPPEPLEDRPPLGMVVHLYPTGMAAIYSLTRILRSWSGTKAVVFGFPYDSTLRVQEPFAKDLLFYGHGTADELDQLEAYLQEEKEVHNRTIQYVWFECPSNLLVRTPDLDRIRGLADTYGFLVIVDDTVGTAVNVNVLDVADIVVMSLSKSFNGRADAMGGSIVLSRL